MLSKLQQIVNDTNHRVLGLVLKSKANTELYQWIQSETEILGGVTIKEQVFYLLNDRPNPFCENNKKRTLNDKGYGFCGNISVCQCFREHASLNFKPFDIQQVLEKRKKTWIEKYGTDNPSKSNGVKEKRRATMEAKDYSSLRRRLAHQKQSVGYEQVLARVQDAVTPEFTRDEYQGCFRKNKYSWKCTKCENIFSDHVDYGHTPTCSKCYPKTISSGELELRDYINSLGFNTVDNTKAVLTNLELDIYVPEKKVAFEFNGVYWHSTLHKDKQYHVAKFIKSRDLGVHLIQVFEDEWINKPDIVKSRIKSILGVDIKIPARKCTLKEITTREYKEFTVAHHLQGHASSTYRYGLFYNDKLVAVMGFSKSRYTSSGYELIRYCSEGTIIGGASKLFTHFCRVVRPDLVVSYANRCWSNGKLYEKLGFTNVTAEDDNTGYWYINGTTRYHRSTFTKKRLIEMGESSSMTESEIMGKNGYLKVYDCGNYKYIWEPK